MRARIALAGGLAAAALLAVALWRGGEGAPERPAAVRAPDVAAAPPAGAPRNGDVPPAGGTGAPPWPSLRGTQVAGGFVLDPEGRLLATPEALELFDYFFAASGEVPDAEIRARIEAEITARLGEGAAADQARTLLDAYLAYRAGARELFESGGGELPLERRLQRVRELRRQVFGAEIAAALFGAEEERAAVDVEIARVAGDASLAPAERQRQVAALLESEPAEVREARTTSEAAIRLLRDERALRDAGAGAAEIAALREERFGSEAAARLAALDAARAAWNARLAAWREEREALAARYADDPEALAAALDAARRARFSGPELVRAQALEALPADAAAAAPAAPSLGPRPAR